MGCLFLIVALMGCLSSVDASVLREAEGLVQVRSAPDSRWRPVGAMPRRLAAGDVIRTGFDARAVLALEGNVTIELFGNTHFVLSEISPVSFHGQLLFGLATFLAEGLGSRSLMVRTPTATSKARSEFVIWSVTVGGGGNSRFVVDRGLVGLDDAKGRTVLLGEGRFLEADASGFHEASSVPSAAQAKHDGFVERMRREFLLELSRDEPQRLISGESRRGDQELGRILTDADGRRVRAEEFLVRSAAEQFTFVTLNERRGAGLSWFAWTGVFDQPLPRDLTSVLSSLVGTVDRAASWTLTSYEAVRSNGTDSIIESASGGHQVDFNSNADPADDVTVLFDPGRDVLISVSGRSVFHTLFDRSVLVVNGALKRGWTGTNLQAQSDALPMSLPAFAANTTFPDASVVRRVDFESYADGSSWTLETRAVGPRGGTLPRSAFAADPGGPSWGLGLLREGFQQTVTATEFEGRSIQLLLSPRILMETGGLR